MKIYERGSYVYLELPTTQVPELHSLRRLHMPFRQIYIISQIDDPWFRREWLKHDYITFGENDAEAISVRPSFDVQWLELDREHPTHFLVNGHASFLTDGSDPQWLVCQIRVQQRIVTLRVLATDLAMAQFREVHQLSLAHVGHNQLTKDNLGIPDATSSGDASNT